MKKAINAWSVPKHITFSRMFHDISAAGFNGIELNIDADNFSNHSLTMNTEESTFSEINDLVKRYNLKVTSISTSLAGGKLASDNKLVRESGKDLIRKQLECAAKLGAEAILTVPGGMTETVSLLQAYENSFMAIEELKPEIKTSEIYVGLENVWNGFFISPFDMKNFIDELDCQYIGAYFDVGNVVAFSEPEYWIEILDTRICKVHVKDFKRNGSINKGGCFVNLLEGNVNWGKVILALSKVAYSSYLIAELSIIEECPEHLYRITSDALDVIIKKTEKNQ